MCLDHPAVESGSRTDVGLLQYVLAEFMVPVTTASLPDQTPRAMKASIFSPLKINAFILCSLVLTLSNI